MDNFVKVEDAVETVLHMAKLYYAEVGSKFSRNQVDDKTLLKYGQSIDVLEDFFTNNWSYFFEEDSDEINEETS